MAPGEGQASSPIGPRRCTWPNTTESASMPSRRTTCAIAGMLAWRIWVSISLAVTGARPPRIISRGSRGMAAVRIRPRDHLQHRAHRPRPQPLADRVPGPPGAAAAPPAARPLVFDRQRRPRHRPAQSAAPDPERGLGEEVAVQVVAVGRPDPVAEPHARIADPGLCRRQPGEEPRQRRAGLRIDLGGRMQPRPLGQRPGADERAVVVAGDDDDLAVGAESLADGADDRRGAGHRPARLTGHQLQRVAEQHEPLDAVEGIKQPGARRRRLEDVVAGPVPEVQVGDDECAHGGAR